jgi:predicted dehydrogenase
VLRIAVVGLGNIAQQHLPVLRDLPDVEIAAAVDADAATRQSTCDRFGIERRFESIEPLLGDERPDAVFVLVSVLAVADVADAFLAAGIPTFLEKPPGLYTSQTRSLAERARSTGTLAMVGVNRRFYSTHLEGRRRLLAAGPPRTVTVDAHEDIERIRRGTKFPEVVVKRWSAANGIHALDMLRFFGGDVRRVRAEHRSFEGPMPDACSAILEFESGAMGRAAMDWTAPGGHRYEVRGPGVVLTSGPGFGTAVWQERGREPETIDLDAVDRDYKPGFYRQDDTFLQCVRDGVPVPFPACDLDDAVKTMAMIDRISGTGDSDS